MQKIRSSSGFTLIEVIVSIAALGIMSVPLLSILYVCTINNIHSKASERAISTAQAVMEWYKCQRVYKIHNLVNIKGNGNSGVFCYFIKDNEILILSQILNDSSRCLLGQESDEFTEMVSRASLTTAEYDYAIKVILDIRNDSAGYGKLVQIAVTVWNRMDKGYKRVHLISLIGE